MRSYRLLLLDDLDLNAEKNPFLLLVVDESPLLVAAEAPTLLFFIFLSLILILISLGCTHLLSIHSL